MEIRRSLESELAYARKIADAGWTGIASARQGFDRSLFTSAKTAIWLPAAIGAGVGVLSRCVIGKRRSVSNVALSGFVGSVVGFGAGVAWKSRQVTGRAARNSMRMINEVRDAHWLERHPIDYA
jgi:hypothetical protein